MCPSSNKVKGNRLTREMRQQVERGERVRFTRQSSLSTFPAARFESWETLAMAVASTSHEPGI